MSNTKIGISLFNDLCKQFLLEAQSSLASKPSEKQLSELFKKAQETLALAIANHNLLPTTELSPLLKKVALASQSLNQAVGIEQFSQAREEFHKFQELLIHTSKLSEHVLELQSKKQKRSPEALRQLLFDDLKALRTANADVTKKIIKETNCEKQNVLKSIWKEIIAADSNAGDSLDLTNYPPKAISDLLIHMGSQIKEVIVPASFFQTQACNDLMNLINQGQQFGKGVVALHIVQNKDAASPLPVKGEVLFNMISLFPSVKELRMPPLILEDDPFLHNIEYNWSEDLNSGSNRILNYYANRIQDELYNRDERVHHALVRALAQGAVGDHSSTMMWIRYWMMTMPLNRLMPLWILNKPEQSEKQKWERPFGSNIFESGPELSHLLLASNQLSRLPIDPTLGGVDFYLNPLLNDENLKEFIHAENHGIIAKDHIRSIKLSHCENITDRGVHGLLEGCPKLSRLDLRDCYQITDKAFLNLPQGCMEKLLHLDLRGTSVGRALIEDLMKKYPKLNVFYDETARGKQALELNRNKTGDLSLYSGEKIHHDLLMMLPSEYSRAVNALKHHKLLSKEALKAFIHFIYTGSLKSLDTDIVLELITFAKSPKVRCTDLSIVCQLWFARTTTPSNSIIRLQKAQKAGFPALANYTRRFIDISYHPDTPEASQRLLESVIRQQDPLHVDPRFENSDLLHQRFSSSWNDWLGINIGKINHDFVLEIEGLKLPVNKTVLFVNSSYFREKLKNVSKSDKNTLKLSTSRPLAAIEIINALMAGKPVDFKHKSLREILDILAQADEMGMRLCVIDDEQLCSCLTKLLIQINEGQHIDDPGWIELLQWAGKHNNCRIGVRLAHYLQLACFDDSGKLKDEYRNNQSISMFVEPFFKSPEYENFASLVKENMGTYGLSALLRLRNDPYESTMKFK